MVVEEAEEEAEEEGVDITIMMERMDKELIQQLKHLHQLVVDLQLICNNNHRILILMLQLKWPIRILAVVLLLNNLVNLLMYKLKVLLNHSIQLLKLYLFLLDILNHKHNIAHIHISIRLYLILLLYTNFQFVLGIVCTMNYCFDSVKIFV